MPLAATITPNRTASRPEAGAEALARAEAIADRLTARGGAAEQAGRLPDETIREVIEAGLMRTTVPERFGGTEIDYRYVPAIQRALGRGCLATAWTIGIQIQHLRHNCRIELVALHTRGSQQLVILRLKLRDLAFDHPAHRFRQLAFDVG